MQIVTKPVLESSEISTALEGDITSEFISVQVPFEYAKHFDANKFKTSEPETWLEINCKKVEDYNLDCKDLIYSTRETYRSLESDLLNAAGSSYEFLGDQCRLWADTVMTKTQKGCNAVIEQFDHLVQNVLKPQWDAFWEAASKKLDEVTTKDVEQEQSAAPALQSSTKSTKNNSVAQDQNHRKPRKAAMEKDEAAGTRDEEL